MSDDEEYMDADGETADTRKRKRNNDDAANVDNWKKARSTEDKLDVMFGILMGIKSDNNTTQDELRRLRKDVNVLEKKVDILQQEKDQNLEKVAVLEEQLRFVMGGGLTNLVLHGVGEQHNENTIKLAKEILAAAVGSDCGILSAFRIGRPSSSSVAPRPIKLKLNSVETKEIYLSKGAGFAKFNTENKTKISLRKDSTYTERKCRNEARLAFLDVKKTDPDAKLKNGKIFSMGVVYSVDKLGKVTKSSSSSQ
jgi:hypothetical protein